MPGIEPDGFVAVSNGFVVILLVAPGSAAALVGDARGARIEPDGLVIVSDGGVNSFRFNQTLARQTYLAQSPGFARIWPVM